MGKLGTGAMVALGVGAVVLLGGSRKKESKTADGRRVILSNNMKPARVKKGETVDVANYRIIASRRAGMEYMPVVQGGVGLTLTIDLSGLSRDGTFTRNVVEEGVALMAEVKV